MPDPAITLRTAPCWTLVHPDSRPVGHADDEPHYYTQADAQQSVARHTSPGGPPPVPRPFEYRCAVAIAACGTAFEGEDGEVHLSDEQTLREVLADAGYRFEPDSTLRCSPDHECTECDAAIAAIARNIAANTPLPGQLTLLDHCGGQGWTAGDGSGQTGLLTDQHAQPEVSSR